MNAAQEGALFPECGEVGFFGGGGQERGCVVAEDTCEDLVRLLEASWKLIWNGRVYTMTIVMGNRIQ